MHVSLTHVFHILVPEIRICPKVLGLFFYIDLVHVHDFTTACTHWLNSRTNGICTYSLNAVKIIDEGRYRRICRYMVLTDSAYWESGAVAAWQLANMLVRIRNDRWADSADCTAVFMMFVLTKAYVLFVDVEPYRLTARGHHWHCWLCSYCRNIISTGSPQ